MNKKLKATCDRVLARLPFTSGEAKVIGGIIIPDNVTLKDGKPIVELLVESAGPDCKVVRDGDTVMVNRNICSPLEMFGVEYMVFSEVSVIAVIKESPVVARPAPVAPLPPPSMAEIREGLGMPKALKDDASELPANA